MTVGRKCGDLPRHLNNGALYCISSLVLGIELNLVGPTATSIASQLGVSEASLGPVVGLGGIGLLLGGLPSGWLLDRFPGHTVLALAMALQATAFCTIPHCGMLVALAVVYFSAALTFNAITTGANALILWRYPASHGAWLNLASALFGVGCFLAPCLADFAQARADGTSGGSSSGPRFGPFVLHGGGSADAYYLTAAATAMCCLWAACSASPPRPTLPIHADSDSDEDGSSSGSSSPLLPDPSCHEAADACIITCGALEPGRQGTSAAADAAGCGHRGGVWGTGAAGTPEQDLSPRGVDDATQTAATAAPRGSSESDPVQDVAACGDAAAGADTQQGWAVKKAGGAQLPAAAVTAAAERVPPAAARCQQRQQQQQRPKRYSSVFARYLEELKQGWPVLLPVAILLFCNISVQASFAAWITTYCERAAGLPAHTAQAVTAAYGAAFTAARVAGVFLAPFIHASTVLLITAPCAVAGTALALVGLPPSLMPPASDAAGFAAGLPLWAVYTVVCLVGVGTATGFANTVSLTSDHIQLDGFTNGVLSTVAGLASTLCPALVPWLAQHTRLGYGALMAVGGLMACCQLMAVCGALVGARWVDAWARERGEEVGMGPHEHHHHHHHDGDEEGEHRHSLAEGAAPHVRCCAGRAAAPSGSEAGSLTAPLLVTVQGE